ncbi:hypothetical protein BVI2075_230185 [Burkholderia vietnamiensis]|nr:hypothetical protein BVI2075_230185 [Burkholderia vietnamiensis]
MLRDFNEGLRRAAIRFTLIRHFCYTRHALVCGRQKTATFGFITTLAEVKQ